MDDEIFMKFQDEMKVHYVIEILTCHPLIFLVSEIYGVECEV
jgi:hypothetical protein